MEEWERFGSFKERGEWVELRFMAEAAGRLFAVCKPWGDCRAYDVGIEHGPNFLRVQVKSTSCRRGDGYRCDLLPNDGKKQDYSLEQIDLFCGVRDSGERVVSDPSIAGARRPASHLRHA